MLLLQISRKLTQFRPLINYNNFHNLCRPKPNLLSRIVPNGVVPKRNFFWIFRRRTKRELFEVDQPPTGYELVYRCNFDNYLLSFQHLNIYCGTILLFGIIYVMIPQQTQIGTESSQKALKQEQKELVMEQYGAKGFKFQENDFLYFFTAYMLFVVALYVVMERSPVRIYYGAESKQFLAYWYGAGLNRLKTLKIPEGGVMEAEGDYLESQTFVIKETGQKIYLLSNFFQHPNYLYMLLGQNNEGVKEYNDKD